MSQQVTHNSKSFIDDTANEIKMNYCRKGKQHVFTEELLHYLMLNGGHTTEEKAIILSILEKSDLLILLMESRPEQQALKSDAMTNSISRTEEIFICLKGSMKSLVRAKDLLRREKFEIGQCKSQTIARIWFPLHISDLNKCKNVASDVEPHLDSNHPGFRDKNYRERREYICKLTKRHQIGEMIPYVHYTESELATWKAVYNGMKEGREKWACSEYLHWFRILEEKNIYSPEFIPQLHDVSRYLKECTGFQLCPVSGLLSARDFLASLAFKVFQCTQYIRHHSSPMHTPEPDCCHELLGHVPMLCDPTFAIFSQEVGLASLGATDEDIVKLATLYWFTVEFGLCKENGDLKAYGAGLLSSFGELQHALSDVPDHLPLEAEITALQPYQDASYQSVYFVSSSFENAIAQVRAFSKKKIKRNFLVYFNQETATVEVIPKALC